MTKRRYLPGSFEAQIIDQIYDTLMHNKQYPQFHPDNTDLPCINVSTGKISFSYFLKEIYQGENNRIQKLEVPVCYRVKMTFEIQEDVSDD